MPGELRRVRATRYVAPLREGGSLPGLVEADDLGMYVVKWTGAGQGRLALVAEVVVGELGRRLGLPVPELVLVDVDPDLGLAEPDQEIQDLLRASPGDNLGMDFLPGAVTYDPVADTVDAELAARVVWFDALVLDVDRSWRNPNVLVWHGGIRLIDHGAALYPQHEWSRSDDPLQRADRPLTRAAEHVLLGAAGSLAAADAALAPLVTRALLDEVVSLVPADWLQVPAATYADFLAARVGGDRPWLAALEQARA